MLEAETMQSAGFHCEKVRETQEWALPSSTDLRQNLAKRTEGLPNPPQSSSDQDMS